MQEIKVRRALVSVYDKSGLEPLIRLLSGMGCELVSTGGTEKYIRELGLEVTAVESLTGYPSILGGRVKTLHPKVFGGILGRPGLEGDRSEMSEYGIGKIDLVVVDLYPFDRTVAEGAAHDEVIEKIDIGGISLIRAAAKNYDTTLVVSGRGQYAAAIADLAKGYTTLDERKRYAREAFLASATYDTHIWQYLGGDLSQAFARTAGPRRELRYGENPHQRGYFHGDLNAMFDILGGKEISYNNLLDIDAAVSLIDEFDQPAVAVIKHNNACGAAVRPTVGEAWEAALAGDPVSAFGGIIVANRDIDAATAGEIDKIFYEVLIAPGFEPEALSLLTRKEKRIVLRRKASPAQPYQFRSLLNGVLAQERDAAAAAPGQWRSATRSQPDARETADLRFANILAKHSKSNTIVLAKDLQLVGSGVGQTSRVDALRHAIEKARSFNFDLQGAVMASDAFFPFADCVEIAHQAGVRAVVQPGGSIRDKESVEYCDKAGMSMSLTGERHFKH